MCKEKHGSSIIARNIRVVGMQIDSRVYKADRAKIEVLVTSTANKDIMRKNEPQ